MDKREEELIIKLKEVVKQCVKGLITLEEGKEKVWSAVWCDTDTFLLP